jgi:hypothetical protein
MQDAPAPEVPDIADALPKLMPELRRITLRGWALEGALAVTAVAALVMTSGLGEKAYEFPLIILFVAAFIALSIARHTRRQHEARIMPLMAEAADLGYQQNASHFLASLPPRLLPKAGRKSAEDLISGRIGDRSIRFAEIRLETGGRNSSTLFQGIVAEFPNLVPMPPFFLAAEGETRGWFGFAGRIKVDDLMRIDTVTGGNGTVYGVWASRSEVRDHPAFAAALKVLTSLEHYIGSDSRLYTASSNGEIIHVALSHKRNLFKIGGLFSAGDALMDDIRIGYRDLSIPLTIAARLLEAEQSAVVKPEPQAAP